MRLTDDGAYDQVQGAPDGEHLDAIHARLDRPPRAGPPVDVRHRAGLLYVPDEHHSILAPQNTRLWYGTVLASLAEHLRDEPFEPPALR